MTKLKTIGNNKISITKLVYPQLQIWRAGWPRIAFVQHFYLTPNCLLSCLSIAIEGKLRTWKCLGFPSWRSVFESRCGKSFERYIFILILHWGLGHYQI